MQKANSSATQVGSADAQLSKAATAIELALAGSGLPGVVVGVTDEHQVRGTVVHGYADFKMRRQLTLEARFAIGSISKSFTGLALMQIAGEGRLELHAPIARYLPELSIPSPFAPITAHHLLTHTSGLPNYLYHAASSRYALAVLRDIVPAYSPGAHYSYSNTGYQVLGHLLEVLDAVPYRRAIQRRILTPLGMASTSAVIDDAERARTVTSYVQWPSDGSYVEAPWFEYVVGDGSLISTLADMCAYARCLLNRGMGEKGRLLSEPDFRTWTTPAQEGYAYGLHVSNEKGEIRLSHGGAIAGFSSFLEVNVNLGFGIVILSNSLVPEGLQRWIVDAGTAAFRNTNVPPAPMPLAPGDFQNYVGVFHLMPHAPAEAHSRLECLVKDGSLWVKRDGDLQRLERMGTDCYRMADADSDDLPFIFGREEAGAHIADVSQGSRWYTREGTNRPTAASQQSDFAAYVGHFENNGPEGPICRLFVRNGRLWIKWSLSEGSKPTPLEQTGSNTFRFGVPEHSPERVYFDTFLDGQALRMILSGVPLYRKDTP
jgi:D-alanyl-D-alanine carboxypeptidase